MNRKLEDMTESEKKIKLGEKVKYRLNLFVSQLSVVMARYEAKELTVIDKSTGEEVADIGELIPARTYKVLSALRSKRGKVFEDMYVNCDLIAWFTLNAPVQSLRLMWWMMSVMWADNTIRERSYSDIGKELSISRSSVVKAVKYLLATNVIIKDDDSSGKTTYYFNPIICRKKGMRSMYIIGNKFDLNTQGKFMNELSRYEGYQIDL